MNKKQDFINETNHRPWKLPKGKWQYYQEWNDALFLHFEVEYDDLRQLVPQKLDIDTFENKCYISIVAFKMENIRPRNLPPVSLISNFYEINVRTYVLNDNKKGVFFLNIEAEKHISAIIAQKLSGLPYEKSNLTRTKTGYRNENLEKQFSLNVDFSVQNKITDKKEFDVWITERYCLYLEKNNRFVRYEIHHKEWDLYGVKLDNCQLNYHFPGLKITEKDVKSCHYSSEIKVVSWKDEKI